MTDAKDLSYQMYAGDEKAAVYLLCFDGRAAIVDAGCGGHGDRMVANIAACGIGADQADDLLLTHCHFNHMGSAPLRHHYDCGGHYGIIQGTGEFRAFIRSFL